jgi:hypothetical protein
MGRFDKGEDAKYFLDLQSFFDVAYRHVFNASAPPIAVAGPTDTYKAVQKATLYDRCHRCTETDRNINLLDLNKTAGVTAMREIAVRPTRPADLARRMVLVGSSALVVGLAVELPRFDAKKECRGGALKFGLQ